MMLGQIELSVSEPRSNCSHRGVGIWIAIGFRQENRKTAKADSDHDIDSDADPNLRGERMDGLGIPPHRDYSVAAQRRRRSIRASPSPLSGIGRAMMRSRDSESRRRKAPKNPAAASTRLPEDERTSIAT